MLTELGGIESEITITRLAPDRFYINSGIMMQFHDRDWIEHAVDTWCTQQPSPRYSKGPGDGIGSGSGGGGGLTPHGGGDGGGGVSSVM